MLSGLVAAGGEHHDRARSSPADLARDVEPVAARQPQVQHDQVGLRAARAVDRRAPVAGHEHVEAGVLEVVAHQPRDLHLVLDHQDHRHRVLPFACFTSVDEGRGGEHRPPPRPFAFSPSLR